MTTLDPVNGAVSKEAILWIKSHPHVLITEFASPEKYPSEKQPVSFFLAGSPGAGKTESALAIIESGVPAVHIDADEIRKFIPMFHGTNAEEVQGAAALGVEKLYDHVLKSRQSCILDGTFTPCAKAELNVQRSLKAGRRIHIVYVFQPPLIAWEYTKIRAQRLGRSVPKEIFIRAFFEAPRNVMNIKQKYGEQVIVDAIEKNYESKTERSINDIEQFDEDLNKSYNISDLQGQLS